MPTIINPYKAGGGMGDDLFGVGGMVDTFFGPKAASSAYTREKFKEAQRQNEFTPRLAESVRQLGLPGGNVNTALADAIMSGTDPSHIANANLLATTTNNAGDLGGNTVTAAGLGAKVPYGSTVAGTNATLASHAATEAGKNERLIQAAALAAGKTPLTVFDPTSPNGTKTILMSDFQAAPRGTYNIVPGQDVLKSAMASRYLFPGMPGAPVAATAPPAWPEPGAAPATSIMTAPIEDPFSPAAALAAAPSTAAPATVAAAPAVAGAAPETAPSVPMNPEQRRYLLGAEAQNRGKTYVKRDAAGEEIDRSITLDDGLTDAYTKQPITRGAGESVTLVGPENASAAAPGANPAVKQVQELRTGTSVVLVRIDALKKRLAMPGSEQARGWVGDASAFASNISSQVDAVTNVAKELGYGAYADQFKTGAAAYVKANPSLLKWADQNSISHAVLESQIGGLAYAMARLSQGSGALSKSDIHDSLTQIGARLTNPKTFSAVLDNLSAQVQQQQAATETALRSTIPPALANRLKLAGGDAAPAVAAPPAPATAAPPGGGGPVPSGTTTKGTSWQVIGP